MLTKRKICGNEKMPNSRRHELKIYLCIAWVRKLTEAIYQNLLLGRVWNCENRNLPTWVPIKQISEKIWRDWVLGSYWIVAERTQLGQLLSVIYNNKQNSSLYMAPSPFPPLSLPLLSLTFLEHMVSMPSQFWLRKTKSSFNYARHANPDRPALISAFLWGEAGRARRLILIKSIEAGQIEEDCRWKAWLVRWQSGEKAAG